MKLQALVTGRLAFRTAARHQEPSIRESLLLKWKILDHVLLLVGGVYLALSVLYVGKFLAQVRKSDQEMKRLQAASNQSFWAPNFGSR